MPKNNSLLYNAAYNGAFAGMLHGRSLASDQGVDYDALSQLAELFGDVVDGAISNNALISNGDGTALAPTTSAIADDQFRMSNLMYGLAYAAFAERYDVALTGPGLDANADIGPNTAAAFTEAMTRQEPGA